MFDGAIEFHLETSLYEICIAALFDQVLYVHVQLDVGYFITILYIKLDTLLKLRYRFELILSTIFC